MRCAGQHAAHPRAASEPVTVQDAAEGLLGDQLAEQLAQREQQLWLEQELERCAHAVADAHVRLVARLRNEHGRGVELDDFLPHTGGLAFTYSFYYGEETWVVSEEELARSGRTAHEVLLQSARLVAEDPAVCAYAANQQGDRELRYALAELIALLEFCL